MEQVTMQKYWAVISWYGTRDMADTEFAHVVWSSKSSEAAAEKAREWGRKNLAPKTAEKAKVLYLGMEHKHG
jgi:hypothetical protein